MNRSLCSLMGAALLITTVSACAGFEHNETLISPTAPSLPSAPSGAGPLTGTWSSILPPSINSTACSSFQWTISSQTANSLSGQFFAICAGIVLVSGNASGQLNAGSTQVALQLSGTATVQSVIVCPFTLTGTGFISGQESIRIPYSGDTCLGPVHGEETLRRPSSPNEPPPPPPAPPVPEPPVAAPTPPTNPFHVGPGPLSQDRAEQVVNAVSREFPSLTQRVPSTEDEGIQISEEFTLRVIWHLKLAGYDAARQRNPSGAISNDKLTILINGNEWRAYDIASMGTPGKPMTVIFLPIGSPNPIAFPGLPD